MKNVKRTLLAAVLLACAIACGKKESPSPQTSINPNNPTDTTSIPKPTPIDSCGTDNPVEKLTWIGDLRLKSYPQPRMYSYIYENKMVFAFSPCFDCGDDKMTIFNCKGETLAEGKAKCDVMLQKANRQKLVFDGNLTDCDRVKNPATDIAWIAEVIREAEAIKERIKKEGGTGYPGFHRIESCLYKGKRIYFQIESFDKNLNENFPTVLRKNSDGNFMYLGDSEVRDCMRTLLAARGGITGGTPVKEYAELLKNCSHPILIYKP